MPNLNCNAEKCVYNICNKCTKTVIRVGDCYKSGDRQAECKSFKENTHLFKNEFANDCCDTAQANVSIICDSKDCLHNHNHECIVSCVEIKQPKTNECCVNAECSTYKK